MQPPFWSSEGRLPPSSNPYLCWVNSIVRTDKFYTCTQFWEAKKKNLKLREYFQNTHKGSRLWTCTPSVIRPLCRQTNKTPLHLSFVCSFRLLYHYALHAQRIVKSRMVFSVSMFFNFGPTEHWTTQKHWHRKWKI
jgi:hypothetical protein